MARGLDEKNIVLWIVIGVLVLFGLSLLFGSFWNFGMNTGWCPMCGIGGGFGLMWFFGWIFMGLFIVALVLLILYLFRALNLNNVRFK